MNNKLAIDLPTAAPFLHATDNAGAIIHGTVERVDGAARTIIIKSRDRAEATVWFSEPTAAYGFEGGKNGWHAVKVTVTEIDKAGRFIVVKDEEGTLETNHLPTKSVQATAKGISAWMPAIIDRTEESGKKVAHFFDRP